MKVYGEAIMLRRLFSIAKAAFLGLCLVLALTVAVLWVRKATRQDQFSYAREGGRLWVTGSRANGLYLTIVKGWPNAERPRLYSLGDPEMLIGPQISVSRGTHWQKFGMHGVYGDSHFQLRSDGTGSWREHPAGVRSPDPEDVAFPGGTFWAAAIAPDGTPTTMPIEVPPGVRGWTLYGDGLARPRPFLTPPIFELFVPHWMPVALFMLPPLTWGVLRVRRWVRRRRRAREGHCVSCGYDLRASAGRCPECGRDPVDVPALTRPAQ